MIAACHQATPPVEPPAQGAIARGELAGDDDPAPSYGKAELDQALIAERGAEASDERRVAELAADPAADDAYGVALANLAVRRRFVATLELCRAEGRACPPRLDERPLAYEPDGAADPKLDAPLRFDLDDWRKIAAELHERSCACRTLACIDQLDAAIDALETRPMADRLADEVATASLADARRCLMRLRGRTAIPHPRAE